MNKQIEVTRAIDELSKLVDSEITEAVNAAVTYREIGLLDQAAYETFMNNHITVATETVMAAINALRRLDMERVIGKNENLFGQEHPAAPRERRN